MMKPLVLLFALFISTQVRAEECVPATADQTLSLVNPEHSSLQAPVRVLYSVDQGDLVVTFLVSAPVLHKKEVFTEKDYPFQFDVTEVFLTFDDMTQKRFSYFEYEVTPLGQTYQVRIDVVDGKRTSESLPKIATTAQTSPTSWATRLRIPLASLGTAVDLSHLKGNFYAILGKNPRTHWSTFLPPQKKPNFHKPEFFKNLFDCTK